MLKKIYLSFPLFAVELNRQASTDGFGLAVMKTGLVLVAAGQLVESSCCAEPFLEAVALFLATT